MGDSGVRTYAAFVGAIVIGGANFVAVSFSNMELPPIFGAAVRFALAGTLFFGILAALRVPLARGRAALGAAAYGILAVGVAYASLYYALVGLSAGTVSVIMAAVPLCTLLLAAALGQERLTGRGIVAGVMALAGIAVLSYGGLTAGAGWSYVAAALLGVVAVSGSTILARALRHVHPLNMNAIGMLAGTILLFMASLALGERWILPARLETWMAAGWLVLLGSVGLFTLLLYVVARWTASATVYAVSGMPLVAIALGVLLLGQPVTPAVVVGGGLVLAAIYVGVVRRKKSAPTNRASVGAKP